jgi:hypothetical protein
LLRNDIAPHKKGPRLIHQRRTGVHGAALAVVSRFEILIVSVAAAFIRRD